jgi:hypothetical protein
MNAINIAKVIVRTTAEIAVGAAIGHVIGRVGGHAIIEAIEPNAEHERLPMNNCFDRAAFELAKPVVEGIRNARSLAEDFVAFREARRTDLSGFARLAQVELELVSN